jgi:hypothetical protein
MQSFCASCNKSFNPDPVSHSFPNSGELRDGATQGESRPPQCVYATFQSVDVFRLPQYQSLLTENARLKAEREHLLSIVHSVTAERDQNLARVKALEDKISLLEKELGELKGKLEFDELRTQLAAGQMALDVETGIINHLIRTYRMASDFQGSKPILRDFRMTCMKRGSEPRFADALDALDSIAKRFGYGKWATSRGEWSKELSHSLGGVTASRNRKAHDDVRSRLQTMSKEERASLTDDDRLAQLYEEFCC